MRLQRHRKQDELADAPDTDSTDTAKWGEFRINASTYRTYDTRWHDRQGNQPDSGSRDDLRQDRLRVAVQPSIMT
jgi:hypothetical protein